MIYDAMNGGCNEKKTGSAFSAGFAKCLQFTREENEQAHQLDKKNWREITHIVPIYGQHTSYSKGGQSLASFSPLLVPYPTQDSFFSYGASYNRAGKYQLGSRTPAIRPAGDSIRPRRGIKNSRISLILCHPYWIPALSYPDGTSFLLTYTIFDVTHATQIRWNIPLSYNDGTEHSFPTSKLSSLSISLSYPFQS